MKGRDRATSGEAKAIRTLLREKTRAQGADEKPIRDKLRHIGFWIEDFVLTSEPFRPADFEALVSSGVIMVAD